MRAAKSKQGSSKDGEDQSTAPVAPPVKKRRVLAAEVEDESDDDDFKPAKKKTTATKTSNKRSNKVGKLEAFNAVPFDVFMEICSHLNVKDLLHLTLASPQIRSILVIPAANAVWRQARLRVGLPDLKAGVMSEVQYANLFVSMKCQNPNDTDAPKNWKRKGYTEHAAKSDVAFISKKLFELEKEDDSIEKMAAKSKGKGKSTEESSKTSVEAYVEARQVIVANMQLDGETLDVAALKLKWTNYLEAQEQKDQDSGVAYTRRLAIQAKVKELGWTYLDFTGAWLTSKIISKPEPLTEEVWKKIFKSVIKILDANKAQRLVKEAQQAVERRQDFFKSKYNVLVLQHMQRMASVPDVEKTPFPPFGDFVHFPHVKKHWVGSDAKFDESVWKADADEIDADVIDFYSARRIHAIKTILAATCDPEVAFADLSNDPADYNVATYNDAWFEKPASVLICTLPGCRRKAKTTYYGGYIPARPTFIGNLLQLVKHQSTEHQGARFEEEEAGHFALPKKVADTMSAMLKAGDIDKDTGTMAELERVGEFEWKNAGSKPDKGWFWKTLLEEVYRKTCLVANPRPLATPVLKKHMICGKLAGDWNKEFHDQWVAKHGDAPSAASGGVMFMGDSDEEDYYGMSEGDGYGFFDSEDEMFMF
ncbi:hypothetical protein P7C70_g267, partial [Phenoliferia sp. Uapishka_3]